MDLTALPVPQGQEDQHDADMAIFSGRGWR
jgi:hypothetical protein